MSCRGQRTSSRPLQLGEKSARTKPSCLKNPDMVDWNNFLANSPHVITRVIAKKMDIEVTNLITKIGVNP